MEIEVLCRRREVWDNYPFFDNLVFLCEKKLDVLSSYVVKIIFFFIQMQSYAILNTFHGQTLVNFSKVKEVKVKYIKFSESCPFLGFLKGSKNWRARWWICGGYEGIRARDKEGIIL